MDTHSPGSTQNNITKWKSDVGFRPLVKHEKALRQTVAQCGGSLSFLLSQNMTALHYVLCLFVLSFKDIPKVPRITTSKLPVNAEVMRRDGSGVKDCQMVKVNLYCYYTLMARRWPSAPNGAANMFIESQRISCHHKPSAALLWMSLAFLPQLTLTCPHLWLSCKQGFMEHFP